MNKGQFSLTSIIVAGITGVLGLAGVWITSNSKINREVGDVRQEAAIIKTTEDLHYKELKNLVEGTDKKVDKIGNKLDMLIERK